MMKTKRLPHRDRYAEFYCYNSTNEFYYNYAVYTAGRIYAQASTDFTMSETIKFFDGIGTFKNQWIYLWGVLGFWGDKKENSERHYIKYMHNKYNRVYRRKNIVIKYTPKDNYMAYKFEVKYLNRVNKGFNITRSLYKPAGLDYTGYEYTREESVYPGKFGEFTKARRRDFIVLISFWDYFFNKLIDRYEEIIEPVMDTGGDIENIDDYNIDYILFFRLHSVNNMFIRYFYIIKGYLNRWPTGDIIFIMRNHFRKGNLVLKKKRYMRKFKIKVLHKSDRFHRRHLLMGL